MSKSILNFKFQISNFQRGFTLLELLIVVAIIGVLASLLMVNFVNVRERSRDAQRKSNLRQIQSALEIYRADEGSYPSAIPNCPVGSVTYLGNNLCSTTYLKTVPKDPLCTSSPCSSVYNSGNYFYGTATPGYVLVSCLENKGEQLSDIVKDSTSLPSGYSPGYPAASGCSSGKFYVLTDI